MYSLGSPASRGAAEAVDLSGFDVNPLRFDWPLSINGSDLALCRWRDAKGWKMASKLRRVEMALLLFLERHGHHPLLMYKAANRRLALRADMTSIANRYGITVSTLLRHRAAGVDNPGYRFHRDRGFFEYALAHRAELQGGSWLDVGAGLGVNRAYLAEMLASDEYVMCDKAVASNAVGLIEPMDGAALRFPDLSFDFVLFSFVLHHAADDAIGLLREARRVARRYVFVLEDPKETSADHRWIRFHAPDGTFRGRSEWRHLFRLLGFEIVHDEELDSIIHSRHLWVLTPV
jgi:SAM-dependent methyltransferase